MSKTGRTGFALGIVAIGDAEESVPIYDLIDKVRSQYSGYEYAALPLHNVLHMIPNDATLRDLIPGSAKEHGHSSKEQLTRLVNSLTSATARADVLSTLRTRLIVEHAKSTGCQSILWADSTTTLAEKTLAETCKGRGFSLPWQVTDGKSPFGPYFHYPLRDVLKKELMSYMDLADPVLSSLVHEPSPGATQASTSSKNTTIDDLMKQYFESVEENFPSTAGLGAESVKAFAAHSPEHIYFTGRNSAAAKSLIANVRSKYPTAALSFIELDLSSLQSILKGIEEDFRHDRLDILLNNAGIIAKPPALSADGYEIQFATNYLGHAMVTKQLLPYLVHATKLSGADVRVVTTSSEGYEFHRMIKGGIAFDELRSGSTMSRTILGPWVRYGQSKLASILFASELGRRYPEIMSTSVHPGVVKTPMLDGLSGFNRVFNDVGMRLNGITAVEPHQGAWNQLWCAAGATREELVNGNFYKPVGVDFTEKLSPLARDGGLAKELWDWTDEVLVKAGCRTSD
ncbi:hypothetical protein N0V95_006585 [Ascochyta clinopodiicola]|nr:hypothetical protein N0V95_006585 [Ascochyta clinopodiicola]